MKRFGTNSRGLGAILAAALAVAAVHTSALGDILGTAQRFAVLGGSTVTNTGPSVINGDLGI